MFCSECGAELRQGANFCSRCGAPDEAVEIYDFSEHGPRVVLRYTEPGTELPRPDGPVRCAHCGAMISAEAAFCERCGRPTGTQPITERVMYGDGGEVLLLEWEGEKQLDFTVADGSMYGRCGVDPNDPQKHQMMLTEHPMCFACGAQQEAGGQFCEQCGQPLDLVELSRG